MRLHFISILFLLLCLPICAQDFTVANVSEFNMALTKVKDGGTIILKNGTWADAQLKAKGNGTEQSPIIIKAETPGQVILTGDSSLQISGTFVIVSGLWFKEGSMTSKAVVEFRTSSSEFANNCRFTNSVISYYANKDPNFKNHWVDIWGKNNRVDHNNFTGKESPGTTLVVWLKGEEHIENNHQIDHNFFGARQDLGENGGETIRIGTSDFSMNSSRTVVENNTFKNCDGEIEIISNKSANNIFRNNLFLESKGALTLRHGNNALVEGNVFIGNGVSNTGGIRVINEGHIIRNNLMIGLTGSGFRGPITIMNGVPNSPLNRYNQVKNVDIQNNTIINCGPMTFGAGKDEERSLAPINTVFANNLITNRTSSKILEIEDDISGITFMGNIVDSGAMVNPDYFDKATIDWTLLKSLPVPSTNNPSLASVSKTSKSPKVDIVNAPRETYVAGAFNLGTTTFPTALTMKSGPGWQPNIEAPVRKASVVEVLPGPGNLRKAIGKAPAGSVIQLMAATYDIEKSIKVDSDITIQGAKDGVTLIKSQDNLEKTYNYFFRVNPGGHLKLNDLVFDASSEQDIKYAIISPEENESQPYNLFVENCTFRNFENDNGGSIYKAYEGTKADTLSFVNSKFENSYRGLNLSYDKDNVGFYNANVIILKNSIFDNIEEFAVNYIRKTPTIALEGGELIIDHCVFNDVANEEDGKIIRTNGIHKVEITNSVFFGSYKVKTPVSLAGPSNKIENCLFFDSGYLKATKGAKEENILYENPKWDDKDTFIPSDKSPLLKANNGRETIGLIQK